ncbi:MAG: flagellar hook-length control protein FliK [Gammaproteobacteria bacterium]
MEINLPLNPQAQLDLARIKEGPLGLKLGQIIEVKVAQPQQGTSMLALELANKMLLQVQSSRPVALARGDHLQLQVVKLNPGLELKLLNQPSDPAYPRLPAQTENILLRVAQPPAGHESSGGTRLVISSTYLAIEQPVTAKVVALSEHQVQLQLAPDATDSKPKPPIRVTLDPATASSLKPGQTVVLVPDRAVAAVAVKITDASVKIAELVKQNLPIHESPVQFIDLLHKTLPAMLSNERVPEALKRLAQQIMQNLVKQPQLTQASSLKRAVDQSGLFLEANLGELQRSSTSQLTHDFKANLLKLIEVLKQETKPHLESKTTSPDLETLRLVLQKSESSVAKIILDQLASLPKEDPAQQLWHIEIPFLNEDKAESVEVDIERNQQHGEPSDNSSWSVTITVTPPNLGTLHCKVSYLEGVVDTHFWSQDAPVRSLIKQNLDRLRRQMEASGLKTGRMDALEGEPSRQSIQGDSGDKLLDEKA